MLLGKKPIGSVGYLGGLMTVPEPFCWSLAQMIQYNQDYLCEATEQVHYIRSTVSFHAFARNNLVDQMRGEWLLMLDTDHVFAPDLCARMVRRMAIHNVDVLTGLYHYKSPPHAPVIYSTKGKRFHLQAIGKWDEQVTLMEVASAGAGCLMVNRSVFDRIKDELGCGPFDITPPLGEDHSFFSRLRKLGIKAYVDPSIESKHLCWKPIGLEDYDTSELEFSKRMVVEGKREEVVA